MALQPCSQCLAGDHAGCDAAARPFCGCRKADPPHSLAEAPPPADEPVEAPMDEVLDAATRAPRSAVAEEQEAVAAVEGAVAPVVQQAPAVDPLALAGIDPEAQAAAVVGRLEGVLPPLPGPSDDPGVAEDELDAMGITPGVVGIVTPEPDAVGTASDTPAPASPDRSIIMADARDPRLHVSIWDGPRAASSAERDFADAIEAELLAQHGADVAATVSVPDGFAEELRKAMDDSEHGYDGTDVEPYACRCGKNAGSLNKLAAHLGIVGDPDAVAELGKLTVPHQLAQAKAEREGTLPPADDTVKVSPGTGEPMVEVDQLTDDEGAPVDVTVTVERTTEHVDVILPGTTEPLPGELTTTTTLPPLPGPSDDDDGPAEGELVALEVDEDGTAFPVALPVAASEIADAVREALRWLLPGDEPGLSPWRFVVIHGGEGWAREAVYTDADLPAELADALLEHFGFDPTPLPDGAVRPDLAPYEVPEPAAPAAPGLTGRSLASTAVATPTRIQVAHFTTHCGQCSDPIEAGQMIGHLDGLGWVHLNH